MLAMALLGATPDVLPLEAVPLVRETLLQQSQSWVEGVMLHSKASHDVSSAAFGVLCTPEYNRHTAVVTLVLGHVSYPLGSRLLHLKVRVPTCFVYDKNFTQRCGDRRPLKLVVPSVPPRGTTPLRLA